MVGRSVFAQIRGIRMADSRSCGKNATDWTLIPKGAKEGSAET